MNLRSFGQTKVPEIGLGCMNVSHAYGKPPSEEAAIKLLHKAYDLGVRHFDTAALYGFGTNESLLGKAFSDRWSAIFLASKCGMTGVEGKRVIDGHPDTLQATIEATLKRLNTDYINLYYLHRWDKSIPVEESVGALSRMVDQGKIGGIGLSEVSANTLHKAHAVHPIMAVQTEYSLWTRNPEIAVLDACETLGITFVAFSPLGRGFLAGGKCSPDTLEQGDIRKGMPRFQPENFTSNMALFEQFSAIAEIVNCTPAQLALAWLLQRKPFIVPIPGTQSIEHLSENIIASEVALTNDTMQQLEQLFAPEVISGARYPEATQAEIDTEEF